MGFVPLDVVTAAAGDSTTGRVAYEHASSRWGYAHGATMPGTVSLHVPPQPWRR